MLKIKDDVDLKELEKFGFEDLGVCYKYYGNSDILGFISINKETREIKRIHPYSLREEANEDEVQDLIQAGLVEKVDDEQ